jgi:lipoprotein-anchoring transpeptidase ErfK/SrfK
VLVAGVAFPAGAFSTTLGASPGAAAAHTVAYVKPAAPAHSAAAGYTAPKRQLHTGMTGSDVKALQVRLNALKYYAGAADGQFGTNTEEAVWAFQEVQGIGVDGVVGPQTAHALASPKSYAARHAGGGATRVEVNLTKRVLALYRNGRVTLISHISPGGGYRYCDKNGCATATTPTGEFHTQGYTPGWVTVPLGKMWNSVWFIGRSYAIHGDTSVPLAPVSHGCVRIPMDIAQFFHTMLPTTGTPVYIFR